MTSERRRSSPARNATTALPRRRNLILASLDPRELRTVQEHLTSVGHALGRVINGPGKPVDFGLFPESGLYSSTVTMRDGAVVETGGVGYEGLAGLPLFFGSRSTPALETCQMPGQQPALGADSADTVDHIKHVSIWRARALARLETLEGRLAAKGGSPAAVARNAMADLRSALEALDACIQAVAAQAAAAERHRAAELVLGARFEEFVTRLPVASLWTDHTGTIEEANKSAAELLGTSAPRLSGRPLTLFALDRNRFEEAYTTLLSGLERHVDFQSQIRPREGRPLTARIVGMSLESDDRWLWYLLA